MNPNTNFNFEIVCSLKRINALLESKILWSEENVLYKQSVYIEILIRMKDLLVKSESIGHRINFSDDVKICERLKIYDVTGLISNFRDAVCHIDTYRKYYGQKALSFIELRGKTYYEHEPSICSNYEDDIAYVMADNILYLKRHVERAFDTIKIVFKEHLGIQAYNFAMGKTFN